jgi:hypothetical protein
MVASKTLQLKMVKNPLSDTLCLYFISSELLGDGHIPKPGRPQCNMPLSEPIITEYPSRFQAVTLHFKVFSIPVLKLTFSVLCTLNSADKIYFCDAETGD